MVEQCYCRSMTLCTSPTKSAGVKTAENYPPVSRSTAPFRNNSNCHAGVGKVIVFRTCNLDCMYDGLMGVGVVFNYRSLNFLWRRRPFSASLAPLTVNRPVQHLHNSCRLRLYYINGLNSMRVRVFARKTAAIAGHLC